MQQLVLGGVACDLVALHEVLDALFQLCFCCHRFLLGVGMFTRSFSLLAWRLMRSNIESGGRRALLPCSCTWWRRRWHWRVQVQFPSRGCIAGAGYVIPPCSQCLTDGVSNEMVV